MEKREFVPLSEYRFLCLLTATLRVQNKLFIIKRNELEEMLYKYYKDDHYSELFYDMAAAKYIDSEPNVNLSEGFLNAYAFGLLIMICDCYSDDTKYIINLPFEDEAQEMLNNFTNSQQEKMADLVKDLVENKRVRKRS